MKNLMAIWILLTGMFILPTVFAQNTDNRHTVQQPSTSVFTDGQPGSPGKPTKPYAPAKVEANLDVKIADDVHTVKFVRDNADPYTVTKAYEIRNANPYAVRGYLLKAVKARSLSTSPVSVDALQFNDGTALLLVSAEEYRFQDQNGVDGIDTIVAKLDRKELTFSGNTPSFIYFPRINSAECLKEMISRIGASVSDVEFASGIDNIRVDSQLNALVVSAPYWSWKNIREMLEKYDQPAPEVRISFKVYEIYSENDNKIGMDFQSWKNNDGVDLFATGARVRRNWSTLFTGNVTNNGTHNTRYWSFNPKWNTRYIDVLSTTSRAKLLHSGMLTAKNRYETKLDLKYGYFYDLTDVNISNGQMSSAATKPNTDVIPRQPITKIIPENILSELAPDLSVTGTAWRMLYNLAGDVSYQLQNYRLGSQISDPDIAEYITKDGQTLANSEVVASLIAAATAYKQAAAAYQTAAAAYYADPNNPAKLQAYQTAAQAYQTAATSYSAASQQQAIAETLARVYDKPNHLSETAMPGVLHGKMQIPMSENGFQFIMSVNPVVAQKATLLDFNFEGISIIGWNSDGTPRMSRSTTKTQVQLTNGPKEFVVDDIQKVEIVRGVAGIPWLKNLPILGWLFADENESTKKTRIIVTLHAEYVTPSDPIPAEIRKNIGKATDSVEKGWKSPVNNMGFQQFLFDTMEWH